MNVESLSWKKDYSVNIKQIDDQHKKLITIINSLIPFLGNSFHEELGSVLMKMVHYTREHFTTEERLLKKNSYPHYPAHKKEHDHFVAMVIKYLKDFQDRKMTLTQEIYDFLIHWFEKHLLEEDGKYRDYLLNPLDSDL